MTFTDDQKAELAKPLNSAHVKPPAPGKYGDYIEGWKVIEEANRIFGFDGWTRETVSMIETNRDKLTLPGRNNSTYEQWRVGYVAKVRVTVHGVVREGTGFGSGMSKPESLGDAIESAVKEAETDAMKRGLMTFGYPFGLALYDKTQANVSDAPSQAPTKPVQHPNYFVGYLSTITKATTLGDLALAWDAINAVKATMAPDDITKLTQAKNQRKAEIATPDFDSLDTRP